MRECIGMVAGYAGGMQRSIALLMLLCLVQAGNSLADVEETPVQDLQLPTLEGGTAATWDFRGTPLLLVEFASW